MGGHKIGVGKEVQNTMYTINNIQIYMVQCREYNQYLIITINWNPLHRSLSGCGEGACTTQ